AAVLQALEQCEPRRGELVALGPASPDPDPSAGKHPSLLPMTPSGLMPALAMHSEAPHLGNSSSKASTATVLAATVPAPAAGSAHRVDLVARELGLIGNDPGWR